VAIMNAGRIEQAGTPADVYDNPATPFVYEFLGDVNLFHGRLEAEGGSVGYVRPFELEIMPYSESVATTDVAATVRFIAAAGPSVRLELQRHDTGKSLDAEISRERYRELELRIGDKVGVAPRNLRVFANAKGK
jgi:sulfate/thiosulfate transport system ATP-binding protein